jgi:hypothetical protein
MNSPARGTPRGRRQEAESERRHRADRDPKEEQRAGRPREVISEHGKIGQRVARPSVTRHAHDRDDRSGEQDNQSADDKHSRPLICWYTSSTRFIRGCVNIVDAWR